MFSCSKENSFPPEYHLQYNEDKAIEDLISLNAELFNIAIENRHDLSVIINDEHSAIHQMAQEMETLIIEINSNNPNLDIAKLLSGNIENQLIQTYSDGSIFETATPCTESFAVSVATAAIAYTISVVSSAGSATPVATVLYYLALGTATYNWCRCMDNGYEDFEGC